MLLLGTKACARLFSPVGCTSRNPARVLNKARMASRASDSQDSRETRQGAFQSDEAALLKFLRLATRSESPWTCRFPCSISAPSLDAVPLKASCAFPCHRADSLGRWPSSPPTAVVDTLSQQIFVHEPSAGLLILAGSATYLFWMIVGWRAMRTHERITYQLDRNGLHPSGKRFKTNTKSCNKLFHGFELAA